SDPRVPPAHAARAARERVASLLCVPILMKGRVEGLLFAIARTPRAFDDRDAAILGRLGDQAATAIHNAQLFAREQTARALAEASGRALAASEARLLEAQRIGRVGSWEADGERLVWSEETYRIFGRRPDEFAPSGPAFTEAVHPDDRALVRQRAEE